MPMQRNALIVALAILTVLMANASAHAGTPMSDRVAVEAGVKAVEAMGASVYSSAVIATPHPDLAKMTRRYAIENLLP